MLILFNNNTQEPITTFENDKFLKVIVINETEKNKITRLDNKRIIIDTNDAIKTINALLNVFLIRCEYSFLKYQQIDKNTNINTIFPDKTNFLKIENNQITYNLDKKILNIVKGYDFFSNITTKVEKLLINTKNDLKTFENKVFLLRNQTVADFYFAVKIILAYELKNHFELNEIKISNLEKIFEEIKKNRDSLDLDIFNQSQKNIIKDFDFCLESEIKKDKIFSEEIFMFLNILNHRKFYFDALSKIQKVYNFSIDEKNTEDYKIKNAIKCFFDALINADTSFICYHNSFCQEIENTLIN